MSRARQVSQLIGTSNNTVVVTPASFSNTVSFANSGVTFGDATTQTTAATGFGFENRIINGDMRFDQRNAGGSVTTSALQTTTYFLDRWGYYNDVVSKRTLQQSTVAPPGFTNSLLVTVIGTDTVGPQQYIRQAIEGLNMADFGWGTANARSATLSFWVRSSVTGQMGGSIQNHNTTRSYPFAYTINAANTWEYKTIAIAGDTSGSWLVNNGIGAAVMFDNGPGYQKATAGAWVGQNSTSSTGSVNLCATNGATWYLTGVQLEKGSTATTFDYRPYGTELMLCQRYYEVIYLDSSGYYAVSTARSSLTDQWFITWFKTQKRAAATGTLMSGTWMGATPSTTGGISSGYHQSSAGTPFYRLGGGGEPAISFSAEL